MHSMAKFCASSCQDVMEHPLEDNCSAAKTCLPPTEFVKTHGEDTHGPGEKLVEAWHETSSQGEPNRRASTLWSEDWLWRKKGVKIRFHRFHPWWNSRDVQVLIGLCNLCIPSYKSLSLCPYADISFAPATTALHWIQKMVPLRPSSNVKQCQATSSLKCLKCLKVLTVGESMPKYAICLCSWIMLNHVESAKLLWPLPFCPSAVALQASGASPSLELKLQGSLAWPSLHFTAPRVPFKTSLETVGVRQVKAFWQNRS